MCEALPLAPVHHMKWTHVTIIYHETVHILCNKMTQQLTSHTTHPDWIRLLLEFGPLWPLAHGPLSNSETHMAHPKNQWQH